MHYMIFCDLNCLIKELIKPNLDEIPASSMPSHNKVLYKEGQVFKRAQNDGLLNMIG